jgi:hypothetical protein
MVYVLLTSRLLLPGGAGLLLEQKAQERIKKYTMQVVVGRKLSSKER